MIKVEVLGAGAWSTRIGSWGALCEGLDTGDWVEARSPTPSLLPPAIRRRAPLSVKIAIEAMQQACEMAGVEPGQMATIYSSGFGDMDLTDRICRTLSEDPKLTSPTHFHNSVHNAATGYWTIATGSQKPANAISAFGPPPAVSLLEAASQVVFEGTPVLLVSAEVRPPGPLHFTTAKRAPFSAAMILAPVAGGARPLVTLEMALQDGRAEHIRDDRLPDGLGEEPDAFLLNLLAAIQRLGRDKPSTGLTIGLSEGTRLQLHISSDGGTGG